MKFSLEKFKIVIPPDMSKKKVVLLSGVCCLSSIAILHGLYKNFIAKPSSTQRPVAKVTNQQAANPISQKPAGGVNNTQSKTTQSAANVKDRQNTKSKNQKLITAHAPLNTNNTESITAKGSLVADPFIEIPDLPKIENSHTLPAIPRPDSVPVPSVGKIPTPPIPARPGASSNDIIKPPGVQGILINPSGGNMAIMSDGTVVSEGQTYCDNRIAYIGNEGVSFTDGTQIEFKSNGFNN